MREIHPNDDFLQDVFTEFANRVEWDEPGEQPPVTVLQAIAAAGGLPDWFYCTMTSTIINRTPVIGGFVLSLPSLPQP